MVEAGQPLGPYLLEERLPGAGGMGTVFRAREMGSGRVFALKVIRDDLAKRTVYRSRFDREGRILQSLDHPNIVTIHDADEVDGIPYIATEFARDGDLRNFLSAEMTVETVLSVLRQSAEGLQAAHDRGIVHRDVKPANLLVKREGTDLHIMVTDFGIAWGKDFATTYTPFGRAVGTPGYMSPECQRGEAADHRADVFSLACCLRAMLGSAASSGPMATVFRRACAYFPEDRQSSVLELYQEAEEALLGGGTTRVMPDRDVGELAETELDTPVGGTLAPRVGRPAVFDRVVDRLGLGGLVQEARLARGRFDPMLITGMLTVADPARLSAHVNALAAELGAELKAGHVRLVLLPAGGAVADVASAYFSVLFADHVPPDDLALVTARRVEDLLEVDAPPSVDRLCDEDILAPLVYQLGVRRVRLNPMIPTR